MTHTKRFHLITYLHGNSASFTISIPEHIERYKDITPSLASRLVDTNITFNLVFNVNAC